MRTCDCGGIPVVYISPPELGCSMRCVNCGEETDWMPTEDEARAEWENGETSWQEAIGEGVFISQIGGGEVDSNG